MSVITLISSKDSWYPQQKQISHTLLKYRVFILFYVNNFIVSHNTELIMGINKHLALLSYELSQSEAKIVALWKDALTNL